ncbi:predicted protein [Sclerotinia sclerotiorum 1980 UF-70]|uniref:Uncharacterized protein n=1 Tax=Sclerotinia sclerotiorum (strain ATCC 18683 / 1980 / Ss-1) TaxID=665079 RepID=A7EX52_SCLS1|nr:predicted protein [Sclerotinia sclerotiorum 1980 UF-70]EDN94044.1 predicted protein [Sclerotinia sclerotiorum 1980 UF-70]
MVRLKGAGASLGIKVRLQCMIFRGKEALPRTKASWGKGERECEGRETPYTKQLAQHNIIQSS